MGWLIGEDSASIQMTDFSQTPTNLPAEQQAIRAQCFHPAGDFGEFTREAIDQSIVCRFEEMVRRYPDRIALKTRRDQLTYAELNQSANRIAHALLALNNNSGQPVGLLFENAAPFVIASLGTLKAGRIQISLESTFPQARLGYLLEQSQAAALLTDNDNLTLAHKLRPLQLINIDNLDGTLSLGNPGIDPISDAIVAIDYTSGSTGRPKGMVWTQRGILHVVARHTNVSHIGKHDRLVMFRASVRAYLSVLLNGGTFYPVDLRQDEPIDLAKWLMDEEITIYRAAVSTFRSLVNVITGAEKFPCLRLILLFGEPVYQRDVEAYRRYFPDRCFLGSSLGCNEMDDYAYFFVDKNIALTGGVIPGGYPVSDAAVRLLDDNDQRVDNGEIGEISVRSPYNTLGYWRQPDLTRIAFISDPDGSDMRVYRTGDVGRLDVDGCLFHLGRKDFQIKIRGYRVDVGEVETALLRCEGVKEAVVVSWEDTAGDKRLIAYIVPTRLRVPGVTELRAFLGREMPDYMVPSIFIKIDGIPLTATGKVDRRGLPPPNGMRPTLESEFVAPRTPVEKSLAAIWAEVLDLKEVGITDNFSELGGDSLRATRVIARVSTQFQVRPPLRAMLESTTIAQMALVILKSQAEAIKDSELEQLLAALDTLSDKEVESLLKPKDPARNDPQELVLVIPFHNEDRHLPWLIHSLREQNVQNVPIVFIDNASTDGSAARVRACDEIKTGKWLYLEEKNVGKVHAMKTATEYCKERFGARYVGFLDSDSYLGDSAWVHNSLEITESAGERFGFSYSPISYFGFDKWPTFKDAYLAYSEVLQFIVNNIGWLANGQGFVCSVDTLNQYFQNAQLTTEVDLRCSLLALFREQQAFLNPSVLISSGRRIVANANNFSAWCFYEREFYSEKDINARQKLDLKFSDRMQDFQPSMVKQFFKRRAMKIACRHLMPLAIFDRGGSYFHKMKSVLGIDGSEEISDTSRRFPDSADWLLTDRFEKMIIAIEEDRATIAVAECIESLMGERYEQRGVSAASLHTI